MVNLSALPYTPKCRYYVWAEKRKGQLEPSRLSCAKTRVQATKKAKASKFPYVYVIDLRTMKSRKVRKR